MEVIRDFRRIFPTVMDKAYEQSMEFRIVREIMSKDVVTISPSKNMLEASKMMGEKHIGSLIVIQDEEPVGIVTERDLLSRVLAQGLEPKDVTVGAIMSAPLVSISPISTIKDAAKMMNKEKGRLAVFEHAKIVGVVTASDLIKSLPLVSETRTEVDDFMSKKVYTSDENSHVSTVAKVMGEKRIGSMVITRNDEPMGIFTERDLLTTFLAKHRPLEVHVGEVCSSPLIAIPSMTSVNDTAHIMASRHIRRLPVVSEEKMIGIITARDLVEAYAQ
jgi:CBS domain-containing protein